MGNQNCLDWLLFEQVEKAVYTNISNFILNKCNIYINISNITFLINI